MSEEHEADLIDRARRGDRGAFGSLVEAHQKAMFNVAYRMVGNYHDAQDLTQTAFLKAFESLPGFDRRCPFFGWIYRILINESISFSRRRKPVAVLDEQTASAAAGPEETFHDRELDAVLQSALLELSEEYRQVIILRHFLDLSYGVMGEVLSIPEKTVKSRLFTARQRLREALRRHGVETS
jgi:RNA polymerase sigma-70 factor (ECF subfamily)